MQNLTALEWIKRLKWRKSLLWKVTVNTYDEMITKSK